MPVLEAQSIDLAYGSRTIVSAMNIDIREGEITSIIGPNGCGKSTVLRALVRLLKPSKGTVLLNGQDIHSMPTRAVAKQMGLLAQQSETMGRVTVEELVRRGRYPHQGFLQPPTRHDTEVVEHAMELANVTSLRDRDVDELSGGQRQRAWIAMALAQETPILLLDEPTTYLDVAHQMEIMDLVQKLNHEDGRTIVMVLHDINEAALVSDRLIAMRDGQVIGDGKPSDVLTTELMSELFGVRCDIYPHPCPFKCNRYCVPRSGLLTPEIGDGRQRVNLTFDRIQTGYGKNVISRDLSHEIPGGKITAIIGPNACGKSTLMRTCARLQKLGAGQICLDGQDINSGSHRALARRLALLSQGSIVPEDLTVEDLVAAGRQPHRTILRRWTAEDERMIEWALERCNLTELRERQVGTLSGGQRQRAWFAMSLVQDTPVLILDEPTTFLDVSAQIDLLDIVWRLNRMHGKTIVMVLHDLNLAARYADHIIAMKDGEIIATGDPADVITGDLARNVFGIDAHVMLDPLTGTPLLVPDRRDRLPLTPFTHQLQASV
ncbi:MAG TPA: ABC transporter ATP-binding protein [Thermomicrobiales bacterium]|nr:ABC transporter ATP-binding protein [Thermomicrobiales bacterium]